MSNVYESEVRLINFHIVDLLKRIQELHGKKILDYEFDDHYYLPQNASWDNSAQNLRIRVWHTPDRPTAVYFSKNEVVSIEGISFKKSLYSIGKVELLKTDYIIAIEPDVVLSFFDSSRIYGT